MSFPPPNLHFTYAFASQVFSSVFACCTSPLGADENRRSFADNGGIPLLVDALKAHVNSASIIERLCVATQNSCAGGACVCVCRCAAVELRLFAHGASRMTRSR